MDNEPCERCGSLMGARPLTPATGESRIVCEECAELAASGDPLFWRWFHYSGRFESEDAPEYNEPDEWS